MLAASPIGDARYRGQQDSLVSPRQAEILQLIADGLTTKQTAQHLGLQLKTVHNHLHDAYRRLQVQTLTHAVVQAARAGIIEL